MNGKNFEKLVDDFTLEVNEDLSKRKNEVVASQREWEEVVRSSQLTVEELMELQYYHVIGLRLRRFKRFFDMGDCPDFILSRELQLCTQTFEDFLQNSTWSKRIHELKSESHLIM